MRRQFKDIEKLTGRKNPSNSRKEILLSIAAENHDVVEEGRSRRRSTLTLVFLRLRNMALQGKSVRAADEWHRLLKKFDPKMENENCGYLVVPADMSEDEFIREHEERNKARKPPPSYVQTMRNQKKDGDQ